MYAVYTQNNSVGYIDQYEAQTVGQFTSPGLIRRPQSLITYVDADDIEIVTTGTDGYNNFLKFTKDGKTVAMFRSWEQVLPAPKEDNEVRAA